MLILQHCTGLMITCSNNSICYESLEDSFVENPLFVGIFVFFERAQCVMGWDKYVYVCVRVSVCWCV